MSSDSLYAGGRLLQALQARNTTKRDLARRLGCTDHPVARMCGGQDRMSISLLCESMRVLGFEPQQLFEDADL